MISISKLLYWLLDCWAGHIFQVLFAVRRSHLVVFDRYLPDLLVDPVRYRLPASASRIAAAVVKLAPRADLCVLLDAPAEIVHQRKWELPLLELQRQRAAYSRLFESLPRTLVLDASRSVEEVNRQFVELLRSYMLLVRGCELGDREMPESRAGVPA
jgi:thymidylate kinase